MAATHLQEGENFTRLARLLVDKGTEALRNNFDAIHSPVNLPAVLAAEKNSLSELKFRVINEIQWDLLYPQPGKSVDSKVFDVTLLTILFRNICGLPSTGWNTEPLDRDRSLQANIIRIKTLRNEVFARAASTRLDCKTFAVLWNKIAQALVELNIPQKEIDDLKTSPLSPKEKNYVEVLRKWKLCDEELQKMVEELSTDVKDTKRDAKDTKSDVKDMKCDVKDMKSDVKDMKSDVQDIKSDVEENKNDLKEIKEHLGMQQQGKKETFQSSGKIEYKVNYYLSGTRECMATRGCERLVYWE